MWWLCAMASAGTLSFHAASPVGVRLDGEWLTRAGTDLTQLDVPAGRHRVEVCDLLGKTIDFEDVLFGDGPVRLEFEDRRLVVVDTTPPAAPPDPATHPPISIPAFNDLERSMLRGNAKVRMNTLRDAAATHWFQMRHVDDLLGAFTSLDDRVEAASILAPHTLDPQNVHALDGHFPGSEHRDQVHAVFTVPGEE